MNTNRSTLIVGVLLDIVLVAAVIWVIWSEGERTRQAIREARPESMRAAEFGATAADEPRPTMYGMQSSGGCVERCGWSTCRRRLIRNVMALDA